MVGEGHHLTGQAGGLQQRLHPVEVPMGGADDEAALKGTLLQLCQQLTQLFQVPRVDHHAGARRGACSSGCVQCLPGGIQVRMAQPQVRLQHRAFGPLVPGVDEHQPLARWNRRQALVDRGRQPVAVTAR
ncbi:hypothetical protein D9M72_592070 [compost metagenome]